MALVVHSDADSSLDNSDKELYCLGEAEKLSREGKEVYTACYLWMTDTRWWFVIVILHTLCNIKEIRT